MLPGLQGRDDARDGCKLRAMRVQGGQYGEVRTDLVFHAFTPLLRWGREGVSSSGPQAYAADVGWDRRDR